MPLREQIEQEIRRRGPIPFSRYMEICLYDPAAGYYSRHAEQFGKAGDFYTSSDVHAVFGRLLARQFDEMWRALGCPPEIELLELGPGRGLFARDVLDWSRKKFPDCFAALHYTLQEASPALRAKLHDTLRDHLASGKASISEELPELHSTQSECMGTALSDDSGDQRLSGPAPKGAEYVSPGRKSGVGAVNGRAPQGRHLSFQGREAFSYEDVNVRAPGAPDPERRPNLAHASPDAPAPKGRPNLAHRFSGGSRAEDDQVPEGRPTALSRTLAPTAPLIVFANEFFDALPVEILSAQGKLHLALENGRLWETWLPRSPQELEFLDRFGVHPEPGERIEVCLDAQRWMKRIADATSRGFLLLVDYGYTRAEQLAGRHRGTLMAYRHHSASANPYQTPGEQDITAHVNFTALAAAAEHSGMQVQKLVTQSQFLMGIGENNQFADAFEDCRLPQGRGPQQARIWPAGVEERAKVALQLKHLVTPAGMGESFQVLVASRGVNPDKVSRLSGLRFGS